MDRINSLGHVDCSERMRNRERRWTGEGVITFTLKKILRSRCGAAAVAAGFLAATLSTSPASAEMTEPSGATVTTVTSTNPACLTAIETARSDGSREVPLDVCTSTVRLTVSAPMRVSATDLESAETTMSSTDYTALVAASAAGTVKKKSYSQSINNITDGETQYGIFYYDGSRVWVTQTYRGAKGSHICKVDWAVGYVVDLKSCNEDGTTSQRNLRAKWHFSVIPAGGAVNWDEVYTTHVNAAGKAWS